MPLPMIEKIRVIGVDDNPSVLEALSLGLGRLPDIDYAGGLNSADRLIQFCRTQLPDVVVLDIDMPGINPFEAMEELNSLCPKARVIMYSGHVRQELIERAIDHGAWGYVAKSDDFEALLDAIRKVAQGEFILSNSVAEVYR